jgi:ribulose bisphosphate carboxylase small subunit
MSQDNAKLAEAISLPDAPAIVILPRDGYDDMMARLQTLENNQEILFSIINKLKQASLSKQSGQTAQNRAMRIDHYMDARPDHKASYETLKGFLNIDDVKLNLAIAALMKDHPGKYIRLRDKVDGRKRWLTLIPKIA